MSKILELMTQVLNNSESKDFKIACNEWVTTDIITTEESTGVCVCNHRGLCIRYELTNIYNNNVLFPIGSNCIKKFKNKDLTNDINLLKDSNKIFKNEGKKHHNLSFNYICKNDPKYVEFLKHNGHKRIYIDLCNYYDALTRINQRKQQKPKKSIMQEIMHDDE